MIHTRIAAAALALAAIAHAASAANIHYIHSFASGASDGANPYGGVIASGKTLYGTTLRGGDLNGGTIYKVNTDGTGFAKIHDFGTHNVGGPHAIVSGLVTDGTKLYGASRNGGPDDDGVLFQLNLNGTGYEALHEFGGTSTDGVEPRYGPLLLVGSRLYGTTTFGGGAFRRAGTIYWVAVPEPQSLVLLTIGLAMALRPRAANSSVEMADCSKTRRGANIGHAFGLQTLSFLTNSRRIWDARRSASLTWAPERWRGGASCCANGWNRRVLSFASS